MLLSDVFKVTMKAALASDFAKWCSVLAQEIEALSHKDQPSPGTPGALTVLGRRRLDQVRDIVAPFQAALPRLEDRRSNARLQLLQRQKHRPFVVLALEASGPLDILPAVVLDRLASAVPNFISQIDLVTGTSSASLYVRTRTYDFMA